MITTHSNLCKSQILVKHKYLYDFHERGRIGGQDTTLKKMVGKVGGLEYITDNCCGIAYNEYRGYVCVFDCKISSLLFSICL